MENKKGKSQSIDIRSTNKIRHMLVRKMCICKKTTMKSKGKTNTQNRNFPEGREKEMGGQ